MTTLRVRYAAIFRMKNGRCAYASALSAYAKCVETLVNNSTKSLQLLKNMVAWQLWHLNGLPIASFIADFPKTMLFH